MGANMLPPLMRGRYHCVVFDVNPENVQRLTASRWGNSMDELINRLSTPEPCG